MKVLFISALICVLAQTSLAKPSLTLLRHWGNFKATHNKQYKDVSEESYRLGVFEANLKKIEDHNKEYAEGKHTWTMGVNRLADLTHEEFMKLNQLKVPNHPKRKTKHTMKAKSLAADIDWRTRGYVTEIKDQGACGSCWAFGAIASMEAAHFEAHGELISMSEQQLVDCSNYDSGCNGGWYDTAWHYVNNEGGVQTETAYPYHARDQTCRVDTNAFVAHVDGCKGGPGNWMCTDSGNSGDDANLESLLSGRPVAVAVDATFFQFYQGGIYHSTLCSTSALNHAIFAVGMGSENGTPYYIVKNSWGKSWGEDGYIRMQRGLNLCGIADYPAYAIDGHL